MHIVHTFGHLVGGTLLIAGTSIGVGMLGLPVATAPAGFLPSIILYVVCWLFMLATGLLILEACIWMPKGANLITLTSHLLGKIGKATCWVLYLFLFFCLMIAHVTGGGSVVSELFGQFLPSGMSAIIYVLIFAPIVYLGTLWVDRLNLILMAGVLISYLFFLFSSFSAINPALLMRMDFGKIWWALPIILTAFGYQSIIPTLFNYMNRNVFKMRFSIIVGTAIPLIVYIVWEFIVLGIIPFDAPGGLKQALEQGTNAVIPLGTYSANAALVNVGKIFAFFALTTSFLGISIAFVDFLADGLNLQKKGKNKLGLCTLIFLIPLLITLIDPHLFLKALDIGGGIGIALLFGAIPILMVWAGRYRLGHSLLHQQLPGGKAMLFCLLCFVVLELIVTLK